MQAPKLAAFALVLAVVPPLLSAGCNKKEDQPLAPAPSAAVPPAATPQATAPAQPAAVVPPTNTNSGHLGLRIGKVDAGGALPAALAHADGGAVPPGFPSLPQMPQLPSPGAIGSAVSAVVSAIPPGLIPPHPVAGDH